MRAKDFRRIAREALRGRWLNAVLAGIVAVLLGGGVMFGGSSGGGSGGASSSNSDAALENALINLETNMPGSLDVLITVLNVFVVLIIIWVIVALVLGGAVSLGYAKYNLGLVDGKTVKVKDVLSQLNRIGDGFVLRFFTVLYVLLWSLLFVIPGIVANYSYMLAPYILCENPGMKARDAIKKSKEMMKGRKWRLFAMLISFFGWLFLCKFTLGIGSLFVRPYVEAAGAAFYRQVQAEIASVETAVSDEYSLA